MIQLCQAAIEDGVSAEFKNLEKFEQASYVTLEFNYNARNLIEMNLDECKVSEKLSILKAKTACLRAVQAANATFRCNNTNISQLIGVDYVVQREHADQKEFASALSNLTNVRVKNAIEDLLEQLKSSTNPSISENKKSDLEKKLANFILQAKLEVENNKNNNYVLDQLHGILFRVHQAIQFKDSKGLMTDIKNNTLTYGEIFWEALIAFARCLKLIAPEVSPEAKVYNNGIFKKQPKLAEKLSELVEPSVWSKRTTVHR